MRYYRKIIRIRAEDSPNVRLAMLQAARGEKPTGEQIIPGVKSWAKYCKHRELWDEVRQCIGLDAQFYQGKGALLYPPTWLNEAERRADRLRGVRRYARAIGIDPAEGGDKTAMAAVDEFGLIELVSRKTPDTTDVTAEALAFMRRHSVKAEDVVFDRGGGGKQHADRLRLQKYNVRTVAFGGAVDLEVKHGRHTVGARRENREERTAYKNRRAELYGTLSELLDPKANPRGFAIDAEYTELRWQMSKIPKKYDEDGRLYMIPKNKKSDNPFELEASGSDTLVGLIGHSPDELESVLIAVHGMLNKPIRSVAGAMSV